MWWGIRRCPNLVSPGAGDHETRTMSGRGKFRIEPFKHRVELDGQVRVDAVTP